MKIVEEYQYDFLDELKVNKCFDSDGVSRGVSEFVWTIPDLEPDLPKITAYFAKTLFCFMDIGYFDFKQLQLVKPNVSAEEAEEMMLDVNYKVAACIAKELMVRENDWVQVVRIYRYYSLSYFLKDSDKFCVMDKDDRIKIAIDELEEKYRKVIHCLLSDV